MSKKPNDLNALFADALKAVEKVESKNAEQEEEIAPEIEIEIEMEIEAPIEDAESVSKEPLEEVALDHHPETEEMTPLSQDELSEELQALQERYALLQKEREALEDKCRRAIRSLRKHKREEEQVKKHNELMRREISRLQGIVKQNERKFEILESRQESSREALDAANQRIDHLTEAIKRQEGQIERSKKLRQKEQEQAKKFGAAPAVTKLLPAIDSVELALTQSSDSVDAFQEGLRIALNQFHGTLESIGVSKIASEKGTRFDPNYHEAVMRIPSDEVPPNHILECFSEAYIMNGRLLRAAKVSVAMSS